MRLIKVLDTVNQIEKSAFLKILDGFCISLRKSKPKIDKILSEGDGHDLPPIIVPPPELESQVLNLPLD